MLQKSARFALAIVLAFSLCPASALAVDAQVPGSEEVNLSSSDGVGIQAVPTISGLVVNGRALTVSGGNFGSSQGASVVSVTRIGFDDGANMSATVSSWSDSQIVLALAEDPSGILDVSVSTSEGSARASKYISPGENVYPYSLKLPPSRQAEGSNIELPSTGILRGWGDYLYYLRETPSSSDGSRFAFHSFERYNLKTKGWETLANLPEWLTFCSADMWGHNIIVCGVVYDTGSGAPAAEERVYMYDLDTDSWRLLDSQGVPLGASIVNVDDTLMLVGGARSDWSFTDTVYTYNTGSGLGSQVATLAVPAINPKLAVHDGAIYAYSYGDTISQWNGGEAARHLQTVADDYTSAELTGVFPAFLDADTTGGTPARATMYGSIAAATEYLVLVGPASADGSTDTYVLDWEGSTFRPYFRRASDARIFGAASCIHVDRLYVAAASELEPQNSVFRATGVAAPAVESGNNSVWREGSKSDLTITFTPDYNRFSKKVVIDGIDLYDGSEYSASIGSTVIDVTPAFLSTLPRGQHEMTAYFDGEGASVTAHFTIETAADPLSRSHSRPASLAMTGDLVLIVPFVIIGLGAVGLAVYLVVRRLRDR